MNGMSAPPSREAAWARAFRARLDEVAALGGERGRPDLGRAPSRLWLMEPDELERLPIRDFIAAFEVPRGAVPRRRATSSPPDCRGGWADLRGSNPIQTPPPVAVSHGAPCLGSSPSGEVSDPRRGVWRRLSLTAGAAAVLAFLIG
jgi:hypothetical protein